MVCTSQRLRNRDERPRFGVGNRALPLHNLDKQGRSPSLLYMNRPKYSSAKKPKQDGQRKNLSQPKTSKPKSLPKASSRLSNRDQNNKQFSKINRLMRPSSLKKFPSNKIVQKKQQQTVIENDLGRIMKKRGKEPKPVIKSSVTKVISNKPKTRGKIAEYVTQYPILHELKVDKGISPLPFSQPYYIAQIVRSFIVEQGMVMAKDHMLQTVQYLKHLQLLTKPTDEEISQKKLNLPKRPEYKNSKTVVFDLDETLIHCNDKVLPSCDCVLPIVFPSGDVINAGIFVRPHASQILKRLHKQFQVIVFTASHSCYANQVINHLDPQRKYISHRLFRQHCWHTDIGLYIKDLRIINRKLSDIVLIDNAVYSYYFQMTNGIPIVPYHQGKQDAELLHLQHYLAELKDVPDVRAFNRQRLKLDEYANYEDSISLLSELYPQVITAMQVRLS